ncbi:YeiH family protein [Methylobacterium nodulans]|uniref:Uncharacterized protein n=1 Tax=Methylobacterium nodulans (strain LMG 21967 / CNCM I-2342 / ORS 2060) TaxID=460265 RepID=B8IFC9_METNO|nr:putative sulfate exporter family transporter [Methylobacterium nodulans]ACL57664.1 conserved hypothetical protein [Methylobacterium nodulans ORS 2060]
MSSSVTPAAAGTAPKFGTIHEIAPGLVFAAAVAIVSTWLQPLLPKSIPLPAMVLALLIGVLLHRSATHALFQPGMRFCVKSLLRWSVALLGLRIALGDIFDLGVGAAVVVVAAMAATMVSSFVLARIFGQSPMYAALAGAATAVCGASAALATSTVVPSYREKDADIAFVVIGVNLLATGAMLLYPLLGHWLGFTDRATGILLGGTIHDVAQVVGSGYSVSEEAGNAAVIVKLFRVFLLLPVVLAVSCYFTRSGLRSGEGKVPMPTFAFAFLLLCIVNSVAPGYPAIAPLFASVKSVLISISTWGLLLAIAALGLNTSLHAITSLGWRHIATLVGSAFVIFATMAAGLAIL